MPIDPSIALDVTGGGGPSAPPNPAAAGGGLSIGSFGSILQMEQQMNQMKQFNTQYAARQRLGQIMSQSPDLETGLANAAKDQLVTGFAGADLGQIRQNYQTQVATQGEQQKQNASALQAVVKGVGAAQLTDPSSMADMLKAQFAALPAGVQKQAAPAVQAYVQAITDGNPSPQQQKARAVGALVGTGMDPGALSSLTGSVGMQQLGDRVAPYAQAPAWAGGAVQSAPGGMGMGVAPSWGEVGGTAALRPAISANGQMQGMPQAPLGNMPQGASPPVSSVPAGASSPSNALGASSPSNALAPGASGASDGALASLPTYLQRSPTANAPTNPWGIPIISKPQQDRIEQLNTEFNGDDYKATQAAKSTLGSLQYLNADIDNLAKAGGFQAPGPAGELRAKLASSFNTLATGLGADKLPFDPKSIASAEQLIKNTNTLAFQLTNQYEGSQRAAAETINKAMNAVPGIENSYLGAKVLASGLEATSQRQMDYRDFRTQWLNNPANHGDLGNADVAFNKLHPPEEYTGKVLGQYGLGPKGFTDPMAVKNAVANKWITPQQAADALVSQFPDRFARQVAAPPAAAAQAQ